MPKFNTRWINGKAVKVPYRIDWQLPDVFRMQSAFDALIQNLIETVKEHPDKHGLVLTPTQKDLHAVIRDLVLALKCYGYKASLCLEHLDRPTYILASKDNQSTQIYISSFENVANALRFRQIHWTAIFGKTPVPLRVWNEIQVRFSYPGDWAPLVLVSSDPQKIIPDASEQPLTNELAISRVADALEGIDDKLGSFLELMKAGESEGLWEKIYSALQLEAEDNDSDENIDESEDAPKGIVFTNIRDMQKRFDEVLKKNGYK